jgi:hypothetical protein
MSTSTTALMAAPLHDQPAATAEELAEQLALLNERLAAATAERDAYRDALVRIRLAMHGMPSL